MITANRFVNTRKKRGVPTASVQFCCIQYYSANISRLPTSTQTQPIPTKLGIVGKLMTSLTASGTLAVPIVAFMPSKRTAKIRPYCPGAPDGSKIEHRIMYVGLSTRPWHPRRTENKSTKFVASARPRTREDVHVLFPILARKIRAATSGAAISSAMMYNMRYVQAIVGLPIPHVGAHDGTEAVH